MRFTFLGTGTSQGVPVIACDCTACKSADPRDKRLRSSLLLEKDGTVLLFDAGPDFRQQMLRQNVKRLDSIILTHEHKDHIAGMDDVRAFNYRSNDAVDIYAEARVQEAIKREYSYVFSSSGYPGIPRMRLKTIENSPFMIKGIEIIPVRVMHWNLEILGFRVNNFAYITHASSIPKRGIELLKGVEYLVINALRKERHMSHFSLDEALSIIDSINPRKGYITHIGHQMGLYEKVQKELPRNVLLAYDGLSVDIEG
ncbi:MAG TPA: MBL fold metallo-hydrolase, partial [Bacteroidetes bacterium]|nr:MBL fold metallo-hydrolase [Bacteroidota bacterium]